MCQAFSCLVTKSKKVYWEVGEDSHDKLQSKYVKKDKELKDDKEPPNNTFARIEIVPNNGNYLKSNGVWVYQIDERVKPKWIDKSYEKPCRDEWKKWKDEIYKKFNLEEALHPIHPFKIKPPKKITKKHLDLLREWDSVWDFVWASVRASVWDLVGDSVGASVRDSVRASVWASVWAYSGSLFTGIKKWKYIKHKAGVYPFNSVVKLWKLGLVPSYDGEVWRLYGGKKAKILWEGKI